MQRQKKARGKASHLQDDDLIIKMTRGLDTLRMVEEREREVEVKIGMNFPLNQ